MKRPPGLWLLLSAGVLWLTVQNGHAIKATSLIFGKTTTTSTSSPEDAVVEETSVAAENPTAGDPSNSTKPTLTGVPQVDYVWDPNLPKELNGYNLTEYPFYERVPEDIDFKCDGLHDGFYASVPHKCQVYHHCLFGTRYDFLCANYTAFDQKTFICHFVSEVDCVNSKKFWHRNDALYQAATTTTVKPPVVHTPPPAPAALHPQAPTQSAVDQRRPGGGRRRPFRRRPQYDYYDYEEEDDYYEERPRKRPRPRPRPLYDDEYEEYEEERYERRRPGRRRPYYDRRGYDDRRPGRRRANKNNERKPQEEEDYEYEAPRYHPRGKPKKDQRDEEHERPRKPPIRRPPDDYDEEPPPPKAPGESKMIIKPVSGSSVYDRPRAAPRIRPPVPKHEQDKFAYKHVAVTKAPEVAEEYYDDYEEEVVAPKPTSTEAAGTTAKKPAKVQEEAEEEKRHMASQSRPRGYSSKRPEEEEEEERPNFRRTYKRPRPKYGQGRYGRLGQKHEEYEEEYEELEPVDEPPAAKTTTPKATTPKEAKEQVVRIVKRPFLPSRGGNPYAARGLKPVGLKASQDAPKTDTDDLEHLMKVAQKEETEKPTSKPTATPEPEYEDEEEEEPKPVARPHTYLTKEDVDEVTKPTDKNEKTLDTINESEYDVTLNDALNPTLPNLPIRAFPTGFSAELGYRQRPRLISESTDVAYQAKLPPPQFRQFVNRNVEYAGQYSTLAGHISPLRAKGKVTQAQTRAFYSNYK